MYKIHHFVHFFNVQISRQVIFNTDLHATNHFTFFPFIKRLSFQLDR